MDKEEIMNELKYWLNFEMVKINKPELINIINLIKDIQQENKQLKDNWNKLKEWAKYERKVAVGMQNGYGTSLCDCMMNKMQELEGKSE